MKAKECPTIKRRVQGEAGFNSRVINNSFFEKSNFDGDFAASVAALLAKQQVDYLDHDQQFKNTNNNEKSQNNETGALYEIWWYRNTCM